MRRSKMVLTLGLLVASAASVAASAQQPVTAKPAVRLPKGSEIKIRMDYGVSSKAARVDDPVYLHVVEPVVYNGVIVIPEGARVTGRVAESSQADGLAIEVKFVDVGIDGRIPIQGAAADRKKRPGASVSDGVLSVPLGRRKSFNLPAGTALLAYTDKDY